ncbi:MAG TPA: hypothetical protein VJB12_06345 [Candidatus Nanoarchaeia archaeon]|nr:hypothetical protein [Candidatus Nanoarchaeia archaeon]
MIISIDTKQDSPDDIRKAISMLRSLIGEQDTITTPAQAPPAQDVSFASLFDSAPEMQGASTDLSGQSTNMPLSAASEPKKSDADLFSDLFSEEDLPEAEDKKEPPQEDEEPYSTSKKPKIEFY